MQRERAVLVLKYVWNTKGVEERMPFLLRMHLEEERVGDGDGETLSVTATCTVTRNHDEGAMKELSITGIFNEGMAECKGHSEMDDVDFLWSHDVPEKFMWSLKKHRVENECKLVAQFRAKTVGPKALKLKMQFEIEDCGVSDLRMVVDPEGDAQITKTVRRIRSGEIILK